MGVFTYNKNGGPKGDILFQGKPIRREHIDEVLAVRQNHIVPDHKETTLIVSAAFAIASQSTNFERAVQLAAHLNTLDAATLRDPAQLFRQSKPYLRFTDKNRFLPFLRFADRYGGMEGLAANVLANPANTREAMAQVPWIGYKTATFIQLCWGSEYGLTIDVHVATQLEHMGLENGMGKKGALGRREYLDLEQNALALVNASTLPDMHPAFAPKKEGDIYTMDGAAITTLFWWGGASAYRGDPAQIDFLNACFLSPYTLQSKKKQTVPTTSQLSIFGQSSQQSLSLSLEKSI